MEAKLKKEFRRSINFLCVVIMGLGLTAPTDSFGWIATRMRKSTATVPIGGRYFFVLTNGTWDGAMGGAPNGLTKADSNCLSDLTANDWLGKSQATLNSSTVKAFLCDGTTCQNPAATSGYVFARSGSATDGGASFYANATPVGPGVDWDAQLDTAKWEASHYFGSTVQYWTGRGTGTDTAWLTTSHTTHCTGWTTNLAASTGRVGVGTAAVPTGYWGNGSNACNLLRKLVCLVTNAGSDDTPAAFDFTDVTLADGATYYESSAVVTGFTGSLVASVMVDSGTTRQLRKNGSGSWASYVEVSPGDTLNARMLSASTSSTAKTMHVTLGKSMVDFVVTTKDFTPNAFTITDITGATINTQYTSATTAALAGFDGPLTASGTNNVEVRINGGGAWVSSIAVNPGDTLNVRMNSNNGLMSNVATSIVTIGSVSDTWTITNNAITVSTTVLTSSGNYTVPADWNDANNQIECIGGGGGGDNAPQSAGGGGAYAKVLNADLTPTNVLAYVIGGGGAINAAGGNSSFNTSLVVAAGGSSGATTRAGGTVAASTGAIKYAGGTGGLGNADSGGGGGGAAGPYGNGGNGGDFGGRGGGGGGGNGGGGNGTAGGPPSGDHGGNGGSNYLGAGAGVGAEDLDGTAGTAGGGGGGGGRYNGGNGSAGTDLTGTVGSGGGAGGKGDDVGAPGAAGLYGAGGAGNAAGAPGICVIKYQQ